MIVCCYRASEREARPQGRPGFSRDTSRCYTPSRVAPKARARVAEGSSSGETSSVRSEFPRAFLEGFLRVGRHRGVAEVHVEERPGELHRLGLHDDVRADDAALLGPDVAAVPRTDLRDLATHISTDVATNFSMHLQCVPQCVCPASYPNPTSRG